MTFYSSQFDNGEHKEDNWQRNPRNQLTLHLSDKPVAEKTNGDAREKCFKLKNGISSPFPHSPEDVKAKDEGHGLERGHYYLFII